MSSRAFLHPTDWKAQQLPLCQGGFPGARSGGLPVGGPAITNSRVSARGRGRAPRPHPSLQGTYRKLLNVCWNPTKGIHSMGGSSSSTHESPEKHSTLLLTFRRVRDGVVRCDISAHCLSSESTCWWGSALNS